MKVQVRTFVEDGEGFDTETFEYEIKLGPVGDLVMHEIKEAATKMAHDEEKVDHVRSVVITLAVD